MRTPEVIEALGFLEGQPRIVVRYAASFSVAPGARMSDFSFDDLEGDDGFPQSGDRLQILSAEEYELLWGFPRFTQSDRDLFLGSSQKTEKIVR